MKIVAIVSSTDSHYSSGYATFLAEVDSAELNRITGRTETHRLTVGTKVPVSDIYTRIVNTERQPQAMEQVAKQLEACATIIRSTIPAIEGLNLPVKPTTPEIAETKP